MGRDGEHRRTGFVFPLSTRINSQHQKDTAGSNLSASCCVFFVIFLLYNMFYIMLSER